MACKSFKGFVFKLVSIWLLADLSSAKETNTRTSECQWLPSAIECKNKKLNLLNIGCVSENDTIVQNYKSFNNYSDAQSSICQKSPRQTRCMDCRSYGAWSLWSECCNKSVCQVEFTGSVGRGRRTRYRNLTTICLKNFNIERECSYENEVKLCENVIRAAPGGPKKTPIDQSNPSHNGLSTVAKIVIFAVAGVVMIALFGFAGMRLVKTMYLPPGHATRDRPSTTQLNQANGQYANSSFRHGTEMTFENEIDPRIPPTVQQQRGHRMMPPINRLSIIQEEDDALSANNQEMEDVVSERRSLCSHVRNGKLLDGNNALEYMDDIINQIENDERAIRMEDPNYRCSIVKEESIKLLNKLGWNPSMRRVTSPDKTTKLQSHESLDKLQASALSLASATLLKTTHDCQSTSSESTSSLAGSESCYSLQDISDVESSPQSLRLPERQYLSEPDLSRIKHIIPDIEELVSDNDSDVFTDNPRA